MQPPSKTLCRDSATHVSKSRRVFAQAVTRPLTRFTAGLIIAFLVAGLGWLVLSPAPSEPSDSVRHEPAAEPAFPDSVQWANDVETLPSEEDKSPLQNKRPDTTNASTPVVMSDDLNRDGASVGRLPLSRQISTSSKPIVKPTHSPVSLPPLHSEPVIHGALREAPHHAKPGKVKR
jgi:hypothetical protein